MGSGVNFLSSRRADQGILVEPPQPGRLVPPNECFRDLTTNPERGGEAVSLRSAYKGGNTSDSGAGCDFQNLEGYPRRGVGRIPRRPICIQQIPWKAAEPSARRIKKIVHPSPGFQFFVIEFQKMGFRNSFRVFQQHGVRPQGVWPAESQRVILGTPERGTRGAVLPFRSDLSGERVNRAERSVLGIATTPEPAFEKRDF